MFHLSVALYYFTSKQKSYFVIDIRNPFIIFLLQIIQLQIQRIHLAYYYIKIMKSITQLLFSYQKKNQLEGQWPWIPRELQQCVYAGWSVFTKINFGNDELFCK